MGIDALEIETGVFKVTLAHSKGGDMERILSGAGLLRNDLTPVSGIVVKSSAGTEWSLDDRKMLKLVGNILLHLANHGVPDREHFEVRLD